MSNYETLLRVAFPNLYEAALRLFENEEEAALFAQLAFLEAYRCEEIAPRHGGVAL